MISAQRTPGVFPPDGKLPQVTLAFWLVKILATTLGEVGGDAVSMSMGLGYLAGTGIFALAFAAALAAQLRARRFHAWLYWATIVASTTLGTTLADYATRSLGIGYAGGSALLLALLAATLLAWRRATGSVAVESVHGTRAELFYWLTITCSQTLGTALGDWVADTRGLGYLGGIALFTALLGVVAVLSLVPRVSRTALFWSAFILTRPLGAVLGDFLDKPPGAGGLDLSRYTGSLVLLVAMVACLVVFPQRAARKPHRSGTL
jgi:uncharacterized membrane-anchored protein